MKKLIANIKDFTNRKPKTSIAMVLIFIVVFTYANIQVMHITSAPGFCEMCHPGTGTGALSEVHTWRQNIHSQAGVDCLDCHGKPGFLGYARAKIGGLYDTYVEIVHNEEYKLEILNMAIDDPQYAANLVPSTTCLFCHTDVVNQQTRDNTLMSVGHKFRLLDTVKNPEFRQARGMRDIFTDELKSAVDPNHKRHIDAGLNCMDCHHRMVHGGEYRAAVDLNRCSECHSQRSVVIGDLSLGTDKTAVTFRHSTHGAMFSCNQCHTEVFPMKAGSSQITFADHSGDKFCYSCHNGQMASYNCNSCHSEVPMPQEPITYTMAGFAPVNFNHSFHGLAFNCDTCHDKPWKMEAHTTKMTMNEMYQGQFCGSCHNGQAAFAATSCMQCHK